MSSRRGSSSSLGVSVWLLWLPLLALGSTVVAAQPTFEDASADAGLAGPIYLTQHDHGLGVAWIDFDGDMSPDIFAVNGMGQAEHLYRNKGDGTFEAADHLLPLLPDVEMMGSVFADYDGDGDSDLYIFTDNEVMQTLDGPANLLLRNLWVESGGTAVPLFEEVAVAAGVDDDVPIPYGSYPCYRSTAGSWLDYDRDGLVDLYVGHWTFGAPGHEGNGNRLYRNQGDGTFADVTGIAGLPLSADVDELRPTLALVGAHLDDDLWPDLYVANVRDVAPFFHDQIYRNQGDGTFADVTALSPGVGSDAEAAMGVTVGDTDRDGQWDVYLSDLLNTGLDDPPLGNVFYRGLGGATFEDNSILEAGVQGSASWGVTFFDADQDGWLDLFVGTIGADQPNHLYWNQGDGTFVDVADTAGVSLTGNVRGSAVADYDGDGDLDLLLVHQNGQMSLYRNATAGAGQSLGVLLEGTLGNTDAIGARVDVTTGGIVQQRQVIAGTSSHSQDAQSVHFGLGAETVAEAVQIRWPSGQTNIYRDVAAGQLLQAPERISTTAGLWDPARKLFFARFTHDTGQADISVSLTATGTELPIAGDWEGDRLATPALWDDATDRLLVWHDLQGGAEDAVAVLEAPGTGWQPLAGDWDGDGVDGPGLFDPATLEFRMWNGLAGGPPDLVFVVSPQNPTGWQGVTGDWDGDGTDGVGIYNAAKGLVILRNSLGGGGGGSTFELGPKNATGFVAVAGDWNGDGLDSVGLYRPDRALFFLSDNTSGTFDFGYRLGRAAVGWWPVMGTWTERILR